MDKRKRNLVTIGGLTLVATVLFFWGLYWLLGNPVLQGGMDVVVSLQNGGGLKRSDRVQLRGVEVGSVRAIHLNEAGGVIVDMRIQEGLALPADTRATISADVFGAGMVQLIPGQSMIRLEDGDTIYGASSPILTELATSLSGKIESVLTSANSLLSPQAIENIHGTTAELPASAAELRAAFVELRAAAASLRRSTQELESAEAGPALASAIREIERSARTLSAAADNVGTSVESLSSVMNKLDNGAGTLGLLINDPALHGELTETLREVRALATDIRQRPNRYIDLKVF